MKLLNGLTIKGKYLLGLDWSRPEVSVYDGRTDTVETFKNIEVVALKHPGCSIVLESTAESFELSRRDDVLVALAAANIDAYVYNPRFTKDFRLKHNIDKSDAADAKVIYRVATETKKSLHRFGPLRDGDELGERISEFVITDRSQFEGKTSLPYAEKYFGKIPQKKRDRKPSIFPVDIQPWIYDSTGQYRKQIGRILFVAEEVCKTGGGYREFRRQLGNYSNGYGRIMRSEINHWWIPPILKAKMKALGMVTEKKSATKNGQPVSVRTWPEHEDKLRKETMKEGGKVAKYLWKLTATNQFEDEIPRVITASN